MNEIVEKILDRIEELRENKEHVLIAIDGPCGAGKTTIATAVRERIGCPVIHMDDFYLLPEERTEERLNEPGGNVAYERVREQVLEPLMRGEPASYMPYDCASGSLLPQKTVGAAPVTVIEGSYSMHPTLTESYDLCVFLNVAPHEQRQRLKDRTGDESLEIFESTWIPLEKRYFECFDPENKSDLRFMT